MEFWQKPVPIAVPPDPAKKGIAYRILLYLKNFSNYDTETSSRLAKKLGNSIGLLHTILPDPSHGFANPQHGFPILWIGWFDLLDYSVYHSKKLPETISVRRQWQIEKHGILPAAGEHF